MRKIICRAGYLVAIIGVLLPTIWNLLPVGFFSEQTSHETQAVYFKVVPAEDMGIASVAKVMVCVGLVLVVSGIFMRGGPDGRAKD